MYNLLKYALVFTGGAGIGVLASWKFFETKYNKIADEEIAAIKEHYKNKEKDALLQLRTLRRLIFPIKRLWRQKKKHMLK